MPVSKKSAAYEFSHVSTLFVNSSLLLKRCDLDQFFRQVVVAWEEIRVLKRVIKQLPVEMLQQCSSASSCTRTRIVMEEHYTGCQHSTPFVLNISAHFFNVSQCTFDVIVAPCCMSSTVSTPFLPQNTAAISFLAENVCLNFFGLFGECVFIHCFDCPLISTFTNKTQVSSPVMM
jgi:hypothetical protein